MNSARFHPEAAAELSDAVAFYEGRLPGLGMDLIGEVETAVTAIQANRRMGAPYKRTDLRRFLLRRFPFAILYLEVQGVLWIVAVPHTSRRPDYWKRRSIDEE